MIIESKIITDLHIHSIDNLYKLKLLILKVNKSQIGKELGIDRRTVDKYINGFKKSKTRNSNNCISSYYNIIKELLDTNNSQIFYYKSVLWHYLIENHDYSGSYANFCLYLKNMRNLRSILEVGDQQMLTT